MTSSRSARPQRRQLDLHAAQTEIEIGAESALLGHGVEIAMGGADQADIDRHRLQRAERPDFAVLQHPQQPRLQCQRHVADLVEKQRAAVGLHDQPLRAVAPRAGEGAGLVAEQLGIDQAFRHRRAVQRDIVARRDCRLHEWRARTRPCRRRSRRAAAPAYCRRRPSQPLHAL